MKEIRVELGERSYSISIGNNILDAIGDALKSLISARRSLS